MNIVKPFKAGITFTTNGLTHNNGDSLLHIVKNYPHARLLSMKSGMIALALYRLAKARYFAAPGRYYVTVRSDGKNVFYKSVTITHEEV